MKHIIKVQMTTGVVHTSIAGVITNGLMEVFQNLDSSAFMQISVSDTEVVILNPKHIVSVTLQEVGSENTPLCAG
ncbi:hypothetical protein [Pseudomonas sp.]|uniref:hypothetical protein n=1 Tax=Pseudomonas sp. TaxID=306 RepID=UPI003FD6EC70